MPNLLVDKVRAAISPSNGLKPMGHVMGPFIVSIEAMVQSIPAKSEPKAAQSQLPLVKSMRRCVVECPAWTLAFIHERAPNPTGKISKRKKKN